MGEGVRGDTGPFVCVGVCVLWVRLYRVLLAIPNG